MVIKEIAKHGSGTRPIVEYLIRYSLRSTKRSRTFTQEQKENARFLLSHNIKGRSTEEIIRAFDENAKHRKDQRKNMLVASHAILAFSKTSTPQIDDRKMRRLVREFIKLRGDDNLYLAVVHAEKHYHAHILISSGSVDGLRSSRVSKREFADIKTKLTAIQEKLFPELHASLPRHRSGSELLQLNQQNRAAWMDRLPSQKKKLAQALQQSHGEAKSMKEFVALLKLQGIETYERSGKIAGVCMNGERKFRFKSLHFEKDINTLIEKDQQEEKELQDMARIRAQAREKDRDKDKDVMEHTREIEVNIDSPVLSRYQKGFREDSLTQC